MVLQNGAQISAYSGAGNVVYGAGSPVILGLGNVSGNFGTSLSGTASLTKSGTGMITLSGLSSYSGKAWIQSGVLSVTTVNRVTGGTLVSSLGAPTNRATGTIARASTARP